MTNKNKITQDLKKNPVRKPLPTKPNPVELTPIDTPIVTPPQPKPLK